MKDGLSQANRMRMKKSVTYTRLYYDDFCSLSLSNNIVLLFFSSRFQLNRKTNLDKIICNSIVCPAIETHVCNRYIIEA